MYLRSWNETADVRSQISRDFSTALGGNRGDAAFRAFEQIYQLCAKHGRRPLIRHSVHCECLGADESCFANFIGYASDGAREDAFLIAATMVRPDVAVILIDLAEEFGLALKSMALKAKHLRVSHSFSATVH